MPYLTKLNKNMYFLSVLCTHKYTQNSLYHRLFHAARGTARVAMMAAAHAVQTVTPSSVVVSKLDLFQTIAQQ